MQATTHRDPLETGSTTLTFRLCRVLAIGAIFATGIASAAGDNAAQARARYQQDRAACLSGQSNQDRATCLREAGAALQAARRGRLDNDNSSYEQNQLARCGRLPASDREDCVRRMRGEGQVSGSVEGGGIYRELHTTVPAQ